jgi:hypothetical protein
MEYPHEPPDIAAGIHSFQNFTPVGNTGTIFSFDADFGKISFAFA